MTNGEKEQSTVKMVEPAEDFDEEEEEEQPPLKEQTIDDNDLKKSTMKNHPSLRETISDLEGRLVGGFVLLTRPVQRQRWGDTQLHPHVDWGDLFFDLFFVAAAYNLANIIRQDPSEKGLLYFIGCFYPIIQQWINKLYYDSRFFTPDDLLHRFFEMMAYFTLGAAVLNIRPLELLSNSEEPEMFSFCLCILLCNFWDLLRYLEILVWVDGEPVAKRVALRDAFFKLIPMTLQLAATVYAGVKFFGNDSSSTGSGRRYLAEDNSSSYGSDYSDCNDVHRRWLAGETTDTSEACACVGTADESVRSRWLAEATTSQLCACVEKGYRWLAETSSPNACDEYGSSEAETSDVPIYLMLAASASASIGLIVWALIIMPNDGSHKQYTIPMNIDFTIHRYGEWTMLMLGESILSLLIVDVTESSAYYTTFYCGIVSVVLLQYMHFRSQPHDADDHAMRKSKERGVAFANLQQIYSGALVVLGVSYKMLMYEFLYLADDSHRRSLLFNVPRWLAGADGALKYETEDRQTRIAHFFCGSMALVWFCSDAMILTHKSMSDNANRCRCSRSGKIKYLALLMVLIRVGLIVFMATLSQYVTQPKALAFIGLVGILGQVILRFATAAIFPNNDQVHVALEDAKNEMEAEEKAAKEKEERRSESMHYSSGDVVHTSE